MVTSDKTIDARGANVHISNGAQITIQFAKNVIIHGLHVHGNKRRSSGMIWLCWSLRDPDAERRRRNIHVWIDHVSLFNCDDGLIDAIQGSTAITISPIIMTCMWIMQVTKRDHAPPSVWKNWNWRSEGYLFTNGAFFTQSGTPTPLPPNHVAAKPGAMAASPTRFAGALKCLPVQPCWCFHTYHPNTLSPLLPGSFSLSSLLPF